LKRCCVKRADAARVEIVAPESRFSAEMLRREKHLATLKQICAGVMGPSVEVVIEEGRPCAPDSPEPRARRQELIKDTLNHPLVTDALEVFKGKLIDVQVIQEEDR
jgi:DNA polymerase-3 subunit gamma/tau